MRVLVLSDIHANITALQSVLDDAGTIDGVWCLGDLVGYGPDPNECIELIRSIPNSICLLGNHDAAALGQIDLESFNREARVSANWMMTNLNQDSLEFLSELPDKVVIGEVTLSHGSPRNPVWEYLLDTYVAAANFEYFSTHLCFVGHTHLPIGYFAINGSKDVEWKMFKSDEPHHFERRAIVNPGSVGQPRDHDPRASYAIFYPNEQVWEPHRVAYDISSVQNRIFAAGLPRRHGLRLAEGW
jgi:diadenosine tetraphosphatase ApaH/serine/threonine PP2A family protein phosphatase